MEAIYICHTTSYCITPTIICTVSFLGTVRVHITDQFIFWMITVLTEMLLQNVWCKVYGCRQEYIAFFFAALSTPSSSTSTTTIGQRKKLANQFNNKFA